MREGKERSNMKEVTAERPDINPAPISKKEIDEIIIENKELKSRVKNLEEILESYLYK